MGQRLAERTTVPNAKESKSQLTASALTTVLLLVRTFAPLIIMEGAPVALMAIFSLPVDATRSANSLVSKCAPKLTEESVRHVLMA